MNEEELIITISGQHGTGKSLYSDFLARKLGLRRLSSGEMFRKKAEAMGVSVPDLSNIAENDASIDREIDETIVYEARKGGVVADGLLPGHLLSQEAQIKVLLKAPLAVRISRIAERERKSLEEVRAETRGRESSERERFLEYYDIDISDISVYDLVLDTALWDIETIRSVLLRLSEAYLRLH